MNNNQNVNDTTSNGMVNAPVQPVPASPVPAQSAPVPDANQGNVVTLGTVSNTTYADTIGDLSAAQPEDPSFANLNTPSVDNNSAGFINNNYNETSISDLNVEGTYNNMNVAPDYTSDPKVMSNIHPDKKNTITIGKELKTFFIIALVLLVFIMVMPFLMDLFDSIRFR